MASPQIEAVKSAPRVSALAPARAGSIFHPLVDFLCAGGLSILVIVPLLLSGREDLGFLSVGLIVWAQYLLNYSHFMASYRLIYRDRETMFAHKWAAFGIPALLIGYSIIAFGLAQNGQLQMMGILVGIASAYLAWHYTGQAWGMMASYSYLAGIRFEKVERLLVRGSLRVLLVWHVVWFARTWFGQTRLSEPFWLLPLYQAAGVAAVLALGVGAAGLGRIWFRTGRLPPARALVAWFATFIWYAAVARWGLPALLLLVQPAHALQYIEFPVRVELNRATARGATRVARHMATYLAILVLVSFVVILLVPGPAMSVVAGLLGLEPQRVAPVLLLTFINIHHYFTDGVAWKLSNPKVRKELFAHVPQPEAAPKPARSAGRKARR
jgi:hypothetical protein